MSVKLRGCFEGIVWRNSTNTHIHTYSPYHLVLIRARYYALESINLPFNSTVVASRLYTRNRFVRKIIRAQTLKGWIASRRIDESKDGMGSDNSCRTFRLPREGLSKWPVVTRSCYQLAIIPVCIQERKQNVFEWLYSRLGNSRFRGSMHGDAVYPLWYTRVCEILCGLRTYTWSFAPFWLHVRDTRTLCERLGFRKPR